MSYLIENGVTSEFSQLMTKLSELLDVIPTAAQYPVLREDARRCAVPSS